MVQLTLQAVAKYLGCKGDYPGTVQGYAQDSRLVKPGDLFFAISGQRVDGHAYLRQVADQGAIGAVVSSSYEGPSFGLVLLHVDDVRQGLQQVARQVQAERSCLVIAITGSVGKTTTKEFVSTLLEGKYRVFKTPGNSNSQVGLPLALLNM
jgi:UDP-N-acetylmuramoyl-tripeptide--D-alanyl-D-alanine ligase